MVAILVVAGAAHAGVSAGASGSFARVGRAISRSVSDSAQGWATLGAALVVLIVLGCLKFFRAGALSGKRDASPHSSALWLAAAFVVFAGVYLGASCVGLAPGLWEGKELSTRGRALASVGGAVTGIGMGVAMIRLLGAGAPNAGLRVRLGDVPRAVGAIVVAAPVLLSASLISVAVAAGISEMEPEAAAHPLLKELRANPESAWVWTMIVSAIVLTPIYEEMIYRAFLQSAFVRASGMPWASVVVNSVLFAAMHAAGGKGAQVDWYALPTLFVLGVAMGSAYEKTGRLGVPILMHAMFNAGNVWMLVRAG